jgi:hypothetical protein
LAPSIEAERYRASALSMVALSGGWMARRKYGKSGSSKKARSMALNTKPSR